MLTIAWEAVPLEPLVDGRLPIGRDRLRSHNEVVGPKLEHRSPVSNSTALSTASATLWAGPQGNALPLGCVHPVC